MVTNRTSQSGLLCLALFLLSLFALMPQAQAQVAGPIYAVEVDGVISRYTVGYLRRALHEAEAANATALLIRLGGGGAVLRDVRGLAGDLAAARVPVVVYVAPGGSDAGAAGAWLLSAATIAVLAPNTSFGAVTPLAEPTGAVSEQVRELFLTEVSTQLGGWNRAHGRSDAWVEQAVRTGAVLSNEQAIGLDPPAVDLVARDTDELLTLLEGRGVVLEDGRQLTLATLGRRAELIQPSIWEQLLLILASPTVAFMLLVMAGMALYAEFVSPTVGVLAGIGIVLLIASVVGLVALPVRWLSLLGLLAAFGLIGTDLFVPSHGALTVVGLGLMVVSALSLIDAAQAPGVGVAYWAVALVALLLGSFAALGIYLVVRTRGQPITSGQEGMLGRMAEVRKRLDPDGMVFVEGALWRAVSEEGDVETGEYVRITGVYELQLTVRRIDDPATAQSAPSSQSITP